jgi:RNA polymerase sigma-B factor
VTAGTDVDLPAAISLLARLPDDDPRRRALRERVVEAHLPLVRYLARRYQHLGEPIDDLVQVGTIGLINAVDRFDPERGVELASYATPTILGEIKRHFRDRAWAVRVPRSLQELQLRVSVAGSELTHELDRSPTVDELAHRLEVDAEQVIEALEAQGAYATVPLASPDDPDEQVGSLDTALEGVVDRESLRPLLHRLPSREKRILVLRFFRGLSQAEIADEVGISQMHVSRLLARTVAELRRGLVEG